MNHPSPIRGSMVAPSDLQICAGDVRKKSLTRNASCAVSSRKGEEGYMLLVAIFMVALLTISLAVAMPAVIKSIQRDRDLETMHRGKQYRRAIQLYYRKFHAYPPNVDALVNTNNIRFLRKKYIDPSTGKDDWKPVLFGQNKTPTAMGFFGQPLSGGASTIAGIGPSGGGMAGLPGITSMGGSSGSAFGGGSTSGFGGSSSAFGSGSSGGGSIFSSPGSDSSGNSSSGTTSGSTDSSGGTGSTGTSGTGSSGSSGSSLTSSGSNGQTFGGAGIIGFSPGSSKQSILVYKKKNHYNEWEFTYDPISDMQRMGGGNAGAIGQPASGTTNPVGSSPFNNSGFGSSPTSGSPTPGPGSGTGFGSGSGSPPTNP
jgi:type II secretory pathway pseudopilin PulG